MRGTDKARALRRSQTDAEAKLWWHLRGRRLGAFKFRRQMPCGPFVADFVCVEARLVVEVDGGQHIDQATYDVRRTQVLQSMGFTVVTYWDDDVLSHTDEVLEDLLLKLNQRSPHPDPLPASGEREQTA